VHEADGSVRITQTFAEHPSLAKGLDISCYAGTSVLVAEAGIVDKVIDLGGAGLGKYIQVNHWWGFTKYAHLSAFGIQKGDWVAKGEVIGQSGSTGLSTGPHLHFEVIPFANRVYPWRVDPAPMLGLNGGQEPPPEPGDLLEQLRNAGWNAAGVPYNPTAAFTKYAQQRGLGAPLGAETDMEGYRLQPFRDKILYAKIGQWHAIEELDY